MNKKPEEEYSNRELALRRNLKNNFPFYALTALKIKPKVGKIEPFTLNRAQTYLHEVAENQLKDKGRVRIIVVKGRQQGISTYIEGRFYWKTTHRKGVSAFILTHEDKATTSLFDMAQRYHDNCLDQVKPSTGAQSAKELYFNALDSGYRVGTAGSKAVGRSTTNQYFHGSEAAWWPHAETHAMGVMQSVPLADKTEMFLESTTNGIGNYFHTQWQLAERGESDYIAVFLPWYWQPEYILKLESDFKLTHEETEFLESFEKDGLTPEHLCWRRMKIKEFRSGGDDGEWKFKQEYPFCIVAGERVGTDRGIIAVETLKTNDKTNTGKVIKQWSTGGKECVEVITKLGYRVKCTFDHRIPTEHGLLWAQDTVGRKIPLGIPKFSEKGFFIVKWSDNCVYSQITIDNDMAFFIGLFMGDGSLHNNTLSVVFDVRDVSSTGERLRKIVRDKFGCEMNERKVSQNGVELRVSRQFFAPLFVRFGLVEFIADIKNKGVKHKRKVCVPECIFRSPKSVIGEFLMGLFDADGFAYDKYAKVAFFTKYGKFNRDVQHLLLGFRITSKAKKVVKMAKNGNEHTGYELVLRSREAIIFRDLIGFESDRKKERTKQWKANIQKNGLEIPTHDEVVAIKKIGIHEVFDVEIDDERHLFDCGGLLVHNTSAEAFQNSGEETLISPQVVLKARKAELEMFGAHVVGVDPARYGDDRTAVVHRNGRKMYGMKAYKKKSVTEVAGICARILTNPINGKRTDVDMMFIDVGGLGAGVYDILEEQGYKEDGRITAVNSSERALEDRRYANKRAEMALTMRSWFDADGGVDVEDSDVLQVDLCGPRYLYDSSGRYLIEKKEIMKKRGLVSPDFFDACALTFAAPIAAPNIKKRRQAAAIETVDYYT